MNFIILKAIKAHAIRALTSLLPRFVARRQLRPIELPWGSDTLHFSDVADFEFALGARTGVLPARLHELMQRSGAELEAELHGIGNLDQRIGGIIDAKDGLGQLCGPAIAHLGVSVFSKDYEWRGMFARLLELPPDCDHFLRAALIQYRHYLSARLSTVQLVTGMKASAAGGNAALDDSAGHAKATMMFTADGGLHPFSRDELRRLPQGEAVSLRLARGSAISLKLARHQFSLTHNRDWILVADNGKTYTLHAGVNCVGRGRDNDVSLDADFRNVSRKHLLAQPLEDDVILLTDISSHGTYVPPTALAS